MKVCGRVCPLIYRGESNGTSLSGMMVYYKHTTFALAGTMETPYYGKHFHKTKFYNDLLYTVSIRVPDSISNSTGKSLSIILTVLVYGLVHLRKGHVHLCNY